VSTHADTSITVILLGNTGQPIDLRVTRTVVANFRGLDADPQPSHWVCKPAYLVPVPSQDKLEGLWQEGHLA